MWILWNVLPKFIYLLIAGFPAVEMLHIWHIFGLPHKRNMVQGMKKDGRPMKRNSGHPMDDPLEKSLNSLRTYSKGIKKGLQDQHFKPLHPVTCSRIAYSSPQKNRFIIHISAKNIVLLKRSANFGSNELLAQSELSSLTPSTPWRLPLLQLCPSKLAQTHAGWSLKGPKGSALRMKRYCVDKLQNINIYI